MAKDNDLAAVAEALVTELRISETVAERLAVAAEAVHKALSSADLRNLKKIQDVWLSGLAETYGRVTKLRTEFRVGPNGTLTDAYGATKIT